MKEINIRRSIRQFTNQSVENDKIEKLLKAAMQAPSAANQQSSEFIVVQDKQTLISLSQMSPYAKLIADAPLAIVLLGNTERMKFKENWEQDLGAAAENILIEAVYLGLGAVWLGVQPLEDRIEAIKKLFSLPANLMPFSVIAIGCPQDKNANKFIDRWDTSRVHYEKL